MDIIEQLELKDLKLAFNDFLKDAGERDARARKAKWDDFWGRLKDKCSVVPRG